MTSAYILEWYKLRPLLFNAIFFLSHQERMFILFHFFFLSSVIKEKNSLVHWPPNKYCYVVSYKDWPLWFVMTCPYCWPTFSFFDQLKDDHLLIQMVPDGEHLIKWKHLFYFHYWLTFFPLFKGSQTHMLLRKKSRRIHKNVRLKFLKFLKICDMEVLTIWRCKKGSTYPYLISRWVLPE